MDRGGCLSEKIGVEKAEFREIPTKFRDWLDSLEWLVDNSRAGWSSPVAREAHNLEVVGSNPAPATLAR